MYFSNYSPHITIVNQVQSFPLCFEFSNISLEPEEMYLKSEVFTVITINTVTYQLGTRCSLDDGLLPGSFVARLYGVTAQKTVV